MEYIHLNNTGRTVQEVHVYQVQHCLKHEEHQIWVKLFKQSEESYQHEWTCEENENVVFNTLAILKIN